MTSQSPLRETTEALRARLMEAEDTLRAIRQGEIDALVVEGSAGNQVYTLHSAEEPYRTLVEEMQEGAVVLSGQGRILYANARFASLVGEPLESVVTSDIERFVNPSDRTNFESMLAAGGGRGRSRLIRSGSGAFEVGLSLTTTVSASGQRLNLIVTDLTELLEAKKNRDRAERDSRTKDDFLAMLGHELRTPLSAIGSAAGVLRATHGVGESASHAHAVIGRQVSHVTQLINDLVDVERVVSGKIRLNRQPLDLAEAVRRAVGAVAGDATVDRDIAISTEPAWVDMDAVRLEQVITNLVANAVKYTPSGGRIRVTLGVDGNEAVLTVEDSGSGISSRLLPFIFDMYVQADRTLDRARGGLGIGLTLVRRLVELHGGTVAAESVGEGHGSTFTVRLAQISSERRPPAASTLTERRVRPRRVLLIEDSEDARAMLRMMLELAGHVVYDAADGLSGIALLSVTHPDAAIIDIGLPGMDGYEVAKRIRDDPHGRRMLLLALTGYDSARDAECALEHGFNHHLVKPVDPDVLARLLGEGASSP